MSAPSTDLRFQVFVRDHDHFEAINDYICFQRHKLKDFSWYHGYIGDPVGSNVTVEFYKVADALLFKLTYG